ncbi:hypothetical protein J437_LFUL016181 [Ladona fulva]|uniref:Transposase n=1 Tax=Ladona fulva TaxID=123851 RepID=A0A8K0KRN2_LADFU|nr:hypothetical protein J437_LFUL016181 [Ladona fulva]
MCRKTLISRLAEHYGALKKRLVVELALASAAAITADCWSHFNKSFMGITVHWIDKKTRARRSAMLTVERIVGRHTFDVLAATIDRVIREYAIQNKVVACVTDNGSNFVKAFS